MRLPDSSGHEADHAALKAEYDARHPDAPLPTLGGGLVNATQSHEVIHELLAADYNARVGLQFLPTYVEAWTLGHTAAHNELHASYNERTEGRDS